MFKKFLLTGLVCTLVLGILFHGSILSFIADQALRFYSTHYLDEALQYESLSFEGRTLVITHPTLLQKHQFFAEQAKIGFKMNWRAQRLDIFFDLYQPQLKLKTTQLSEESWKSFLPRESQSKIKINPIWTIREGIVKWIADDGNEETLSLNMLNENAVQSGLDAVFGEGHEENNKLSLRTHRDQEGMNIECHCNDLNCLGVRNLLVFLFPAYKEWIIPTGKFNGNIVAHFPATKRPYLEGELRLHDLNFTNNGMDVKGSIGQAKITLQKNPLDSQGEIHPTIGKLEILEAGHFGQGRWELKEILGSIELTTDNVALVALEAQGSHADKISHFNLAGDANLNPQLPLNMNLNLKCISHGKEDGLIHFFIHQHDRHLKTAEVECKRLSYIEWGVLQGILAGFFPSLKQVVLEEGMFDANFHTDLTKAGIGEVNCPYFFGENLRLYCVPWNMSFVVPEWKGNGSLNLNHEDIWSSLNGECHIGSGQVFWQGLDLNFIALSDIKTRLLINQGRIHHSAIGMQMGRLKGLMDIEWGDGKKQLTMNFEGKGQDLAELFPPQIFEGMNRSFKDRQVHIMADVNDLPGVVGVKGTLRFDRINDSVNVDLIHFGCELKKNPSKPSLLENPTGWFYANSLPLEHFLSPFIFREGVAALSGVGEFKGSFDFNSIELYYNLSDVKIENEHLLFELKSVFPTLPGQLVGVHTFDLDSRTNYGTLPIAFASYTEKNSGLNINNIRAVVLFRDQYIRFSDLEACCEEITFAGDLDWDYSDPLPGIFSVALSAPTVTGRVSHIQKLLSCLDNSIPLLQIPLEGDMEAKNEGLKVKLTFNPDDYRVDASFDGSVNNGMLPICHSQAYLQELSFDIEYQHQNESLKFNDIQGSLLTGKSSEADEYLLTANHIQFFGRKCQNANIDIELGQHGRSLAKLIAKSFLREDGIHEIAVDKKASHLFQIHPNDFTLSLKDLSELDQFHLEAQFSLEEIWDDLMTVACGELHRSRAELKNDLRCPLTGSGGMNLVLNYDINNKSINYSLKGDALSFDTWSFDHFLIEGRKHERRWLIDTLQLDDLSLYADVQFRDERWKVDFLGLNYGNSLLIGLDGFFLDNGFGLDAKVQLFEARLSAIEEWKNILPAVGQLHSKGVVEGKGALKIELIHQAPWISTEFILDTLPGQFEYQDAVVQLNKPVRFHFLTGKSLEIAGMDSTLSKNGKAFAHFVLEKFKYELPMDRLQFSHVDFQIPQEHLPLFTDQFQKILPDILDDKSKMAIESITRDSVLSGTVDFEKNPHSYVLKVGLNEGHYYFKNHGYTFKNLNLELRPRELAFSGITHHERQPFNIRGTVQLPSCDCGQLILTEDFLHPLYINWRDHPQNGLNIEAIHGRFCGMNISLDQDGFTDSSPWSILHGFVELNAQQIRPLLALNTANKMESIALGGIYRFTGNFWFNPELGDELFETVYFKGALGCNQAKIEGYEFASVEANVEYSPQIFEVKDFSISDQAGTATTPKILITQNKSTKDWEVNIGKLLVKNFKPSLLKDENDPNGQRIKPLVIKRLEINDFQGKLNDVSTWRAGGYFHFLNSSRKNISNPLFAIPGEIILRLGLNPHVLNPVTGTIYFALNGDHFYLHRFKDVYSEGRGSKFYLAENGTPSWIDFKGNLNVQIRMKQYNLIFKIAEFFTVSIKGNIKTKPKYALQKIEKPTRSPYLSKFL